VSRGNRATRAALTLKNHNLDGRYVLFGVTWFFEFGQAYSWEGDAPRERRPPMLAQLGTAAILKSYWTFLNYIAVHP
jgi:hypothetical protein